MESVPQDGRVTIDPGGDASEGFLNQVARGLVGASWHSFKSGATSTADGTESVHGALTPTDVTALAYEACVGSTPFGCQAVPFTSTSSNTSWHADGLSLTCGSTYYVAVRATNCAGLQRTVVSAGAKLCCEPPRAGVVGLLSRNGPVVSVGDEMYLMASWSGFSDACSGVKGYVVSVVLGANLIWESNMTDKRQVVLPAAILEGLQHATTYRVDVTARNWAGHGTVVSATFIVDRSPPLLGTLSLRWSPEGNDWTALDMTAVRSCLPATSSVLELSCQMDDLESEIATREFAFIGEPSDPPAWQRVNSGSRLWLPVAALPGEDGASTFFLARACNRVGVCTTSQAATAIIRDERPPSAGHVRQRGALGASPGYTSATHSLVAEFGAFTPAGCPAICSSNATHRCFYDTSCSATPPRKGGVGCNAGSQGSNCRFCGFGSYDSCPLDAKDDEDVATSPAPLTYEACVGSTPFGCQAVPFTSTSSNTSWHADGLSLTCGSTYYVAVRATNCAGLQRTVSSAGAKLCCEPPRAGDVGLVDAMGQPLLYIGETAANHTHASWSGFSDACSGVREYVLSIEQVADGEVLWNSSSYEGHASHALLPWEMLGRLPEGVGLAVVVTATNHAGLSMRATGGFRVDRTPPVTSPIRMRWPGSVNLQSFTSSSLLCIPVSVHYVELRWPHWTDLVSEITSYYLSAHNRSGMVHPYQERYLGTAAFATISTSETFALSRAVAIGIRGCDSVGLCYMAM